MKLVVRRRGPQGALAAVVALVAASVMLLQAGGPAADAGVHEASSETRYQEVWISHRFEFAGKLAPSEDPEVEGCVFDERRWFAEPTIDCGDYPLDFLLDDPDRASSAELFFDIWRGRKPSNVKFRLNDSTVVRNAGVGEDWSRTPATRSVDLGELQDGKNTIFLQQAQAYHLHDLAVRLYDLPGSYPDGAGITSVSPAAVDGVLTVGEDETITLTAEVSGADAVEFIAYYDGFDRDNDGQRTDWQSFTRNNWHPGGVNKDGSAPVGGYGTIGHIGTVHSDGTVVVGGSEIDNSRGGKSGNTYTIEFDTSLIPNGSPLRFKVRALNEAGNDGYWVVDALGGATTEVELARIDEVVDYVIDPDFTDAILHDDGNGVDAITRDVELDLTDMVSVHLIGNYWEQPEVHLNPNGPNSNNCGSGGFVQRVDDDWVTSVIDVTDDVVNGQNLICYEHVGGFGEFIENPGPMLVIRRDPDRPPTVDAGGPYEAGVGAPIFLVPTLADDDDPQLDVTWSGVGATFADPNVERASVTFAAPGTFEVQIEVVDDSGNTASDTAAVTVTEAPPPPTTLPPEPDPGPEPDPPVPPVGSADVGYWMGDAGGEIYGFGDAGDPGAVAGQIVAVASTPTGSGLWVLTSDGVVHTFDDATHHGDVDLATLDGGEQVASLSVLPDGSGYWVFTDRGRAVQFGAAADLDDLVDQNVSPFLQGLIVDSAATPSGQGAFMVAADGGVFAIGDAVFEGSMGGIPLNGPVVGVATDPDGEGYWLVADDGGIFAFGAEFQGSMGGQPLNAPMVGAVAFGDGYLMVAADGGIFNFSDQQFLGSLGDDPPDDPVSAVAGFPT